VKERTNMARTISYDELTLELLRKGEKLGSKKLRKLAAHAAQSLRGGECPACGSTGDHETNGEFWQCANTECLNTWEEGENALTADELMEQIS
jgi:ribosomal protein L37AE/L43A